MLKMTWIVLLLLNACSGLGTIPLNGISATEPTICLLPYPSVDESVFLSMSEEDQKRVLVNQGLWLNHCLDPGDDTPPSLT